jgi:hypothetical protein
LLFLPLGLLLLLLLFPPQGLLLLLLLLLPLGALLLLLLLLPQGLLLLLLLLLPLGALLLRLLLLPLGLLLLSLSRLSRPLGYRGLRSSRLLPNLGLSANRRLNALDLAHIHDAHRGPPGGRILAHLLYASRWKRAAGIFLQLGLLPLEGHRSRRRSGACYDWPAQHIGGRTRGAGRLRCPRAENADPLRCNLGSRGDAG